MKQKYAEILAKVQQFIKRNTLRDTTLRASKSWHYVLGIVFVSIVTFCLIGVYMLFFAQSQIEKSNIETIHKNITFDKEKFDQVVIRYKERSEEYTKLKRGSIDAPDLGLPEYVKPVAEEEESEE